MGLFDKLNIIRDIDEINTGASAEEIQAFALRVKHNCGIDLPERTAHKHGDVQRSD